MTIISMPNNKKFDDNYDRIFGKDTSAKSYDADGQRNHPGEKQPACLPDLWLKLENGEWEQLDPRYEANNRFLVPWDVYILKQDYSVNGGLAFSIHVAGSHCHALEQQFVDELIDAAEFCSNYGGVHTR